MYKKNTPVFVHVLTGFFEPHFTRPDGGNSVGGIRVVLLCVSDTQIGLLLQTGETETLWSGTFWNHEVIAPQTPSKSLNTRLMLFDIASCLNKDTKYNLQAPRRFIIDAASGF